MCQRYLQNFFYFLKCDENIAFCEITGEWCNHGIRYGVEILCKFKASNGFEIFEVTKLKELLLTAYIPNYTEHTVMGVCY